MSKKLLFSVFLLFVFSVSLFAEGMNFNFWGGPTKVKMKKLNDLGQDIKNSYDEMAEYYQTIGYIPKTDLKKVENAFILGMDGMKNVNEKISLGGRVSYLTTNEGKASYVDRLNGANWEDYTENVKVNTSLISLMIGGKYTEKINDKLSLNGKLFLGYGIAKYESEYKVNFLNSTGSFYNILDNYSKTKGCFVSDLTVGAEYSFTETLALGLDLGYRFASKAKIKDENVGIDIDTELDFSGLTSALNLNYKF